MLNATHVSGTEFREFIERLRSVAKVVPLRELQSSHDGLVFALRHDMCGHTEWRCALSKSLDIARIEAEMGVAATYFVIPEMLRHSATYADVVRSIAALGHEVGYHCNAVSQWVRKGESPQHWIGEDLADLRDVSGSPVLGAASHGEPICYEPGRMHVNYQCWSEWDRSRNAGHQDLDVPRAPLAEFGLGYEAYLSLRHTHYLSDSGGRWRGGPILPRPTPFERGWMQDGLDVYEEFVELQSGAMQVLVHPVWWSVQ